MLCSFLSGGSPDVDGFAHRPPASGQSSQNAKVVDNKQVEEPCPRRNSAGGSMSTAHTTNGSNMERLRAGKIPAHVPMPSPTSISSACRPSRRGSTYGGAAVILHEDGYYRLNMEAGVSVDVARFDAWADTGDQQVRDGELARAATSYRHSVQSVSWRSGGADVVGASWSASGCDPAF